MIAQNINMKLTGDVWIAFQMCAKRIVSNDGKESTPEIVRELIKETPEYAKIKGIPAVQEQVAPVVESPSSVEGSAHSTESLQESQA